MDDLKQKLNQGIGSVKKGFENEMEKMDFNREIKDLNSEVKTLYNKREKRILKLGEETYKNIRLGEKTSYDKDIVRELRDIDLSIYNKLKIIDNKLSENRAKSCAKCGNEIKTDDKFCKECGSPTKTEDQDANVKICTICSVENIENNNFCVSCGNKF